MSLVILFLEVLKVIVQTFQANFLQDLIDRDDGVRKLVGLPLPSYDQLKKLSIVRQFGESETTQIMNRLLEPFDKQVKEKEREREKERAKDRERDGDRERERQRHQDSTAAKGKPKGSGNDGGRGSQSARGSDSRHNSKR